MKKSVVIIGAGFGGLRTLYNLEKHKNQFDFTMIEKNDYSLERPSLPEVAFEDKPVEKTKIPIKEYLENFQSKDLPKIKKQIKELEKLIDRYERSF